MVVSGCFVSRRQISPMSRFFNGLFFATCVPTWVGARCGYRCLMATAPIVSTVPTESILNNLHSWSANRSRQYQHDRLRCATLNAA